MGHICECLLKVVNNRLLTEIRENLTKGRNVYAEYKTKKYHKLAQNT